SQVTVGTDGDGITGTASPSAPQDGRVDQTFTVTLTLDANRARPAGLDEDGWTIAGAKATKAFTVEAGNCLESALPKIQTTAAVCENGTVTPSQVTATGGTGFTISVDPSTPQDGTQAQTFVIEITLQDGYAWPADMSGWAIDGMSAYREITVPAGNCAEVVFPTFDIDEAVCRAGEVTEPTIEAVGAEGVSISFAPAAPYAQGQQVTVTATLQNGYEWPADMGGWTLVEGDPLKATTTITFKSVNCEVLSPALPEIVESVCGEGESSLPSIPAPADIEGKLAYSDVTATDNGNGTITFTYTVTVEDGYVLPDPLTAENYTRVSGIEATYEITLAIVPCELGAPAAPQITPSVCEREGATTPRITVPQSNDDLTYGKLFTTNNPNGSVTYSFDVTVKNGYALAPQEDMPDRNKRLSDARASYSITLERAQGDASLSL